jgi:hypothetical protein
LEELQRRIEELENRRLGDVKLYSESEDEIEEEPNVEEGYLVVHSISFPKEKGSARV